MENLKFDFIFLGQSILKYQVPLDIFTTINQIYEQNFNNLAPANGQLVGKIKNEHSLFYHGQDQSKMKNHNMLPQNVTNYFMTVFKHYLAFNKIKDYETHLNDHVQEQEDNGRVYYILTLRVQPPEGLTF